VGRIEDLQARLEQEPRSRLFAQLAEELRKAGQLEEAIRTCRIGLAQHPTYALARITLARALLDTGNGKGARSELERVLAATPENIMAGRLLGECLESLGENAAAREQYQKTLALAPGDAQLTERLKALTASAERAAEATPTEAKPSEVAPQTVPPETSPPTPSPFTIPFRDPETAAAEAATAPLRPEALRRQSAPREAEPDAATPPPDVSPEAGPAPPQGGPETLAPGPTPVGGPGQAPSPEDRNEPSAAAPAVPAAPPEDAAPVSTYTLPVGTPRPTLEEHSAHPTSPFRAEALRQAAARVEAEAGEGEIVSATLAELYLRQGFPDKALDVYRQLVARDPSNSEARQRLEELTSEPPERALAAEGAATHGMAAALQRLESLLSAVRRNRR